MFYFGDHESTADMYIAASVGGIGPKLPDVHYDEMEEQDLRNAFAYMYSAVWQAYRDGAEPEVQRILIEQYDALFERLAEVSERFREVVRTHKHQYIPDRSKENVEKYRRLAGVL